MMNIRDLTIDELEKYIDSINEKKYRAKQIYEWLHKSIAIDINEFSNINKELRKKLLSMFDFSFPVIEKEYVSKIDDTKKYIIKLDDDSYIETVLMKYKYGYSICISSEVGCDMGCKFCASTIGGLKRNLKPFELLAQIYLVSKKNDINVSNIVIMGSGEPLLNFENIIKFLEIISSECGQNKSLRNITISTCGIVQNIYKLADKNLHVTLALSLHAPNDTIRKKIMPIANKYTIDEIVDAMAYYYKTTKRRITLEYSLIEGVNDSVLCANELVTLLNKKFIKNHIDFNINLIPVNVVKENDFKTPTKNSVLRFKSILENDNINVTIRRELGKDISGSCGQLRAKFL